MIWWWHPHWQVVLQFSVTQQHSDHAPGDVVCWSPLCPGQDTEPGYGTTASLPSSSHRKFFALSSSDRDFPLPLDPTHQYHGGQMGKGLSGGGEGIRTSSLFPFSLKPTQRYGVGQSSKGLGER